MQRIKNLFGKNKPDYEPATKRRPLPSDLDFNIDTWLDEHPASKSENEFDLIFPSVKALREGKTCCNGSAQQTDPAQPPDTKHPVAL